MTLPPDRLGDWGQRFMVLTKNYPNKTERWQRAGFASRREVAQQMAEAFKLAPGCDDAKVVDRGVIFRD